ncbi:hypothetical protein CIW48_27155 [Methylobacterium sp. P1-11]|uniref:phage tail assembly chaperone n=1 Tax=Methylobacterium sp. P1-11 TaxID=2024616 RepID=UPI0011ED1E1D|nr:hypothetical protein [Methylobacterium sp. P1-11]KAA0117882.1 hypothetical protein CIW48_27155 [Methylobacterium sp. P1-11]
MAEFDIKGVTYRSGKMVGLTQIHVLRRAAPVIKPLFSGMATGMTPDVAGAIIEGLGELPDEKMNYILDHTLAVVEMKQDDQRWAKIKSTNGMAFMFDEIGRNGLLMLTISAYVLYDNYYPLFLEAPLLFSGGGQFQLPN